jgi:hypothetical protein
VHPQPDRTRRNAAGNKQIPAGANPGKSKARKKIKGKTKSNKEDTDEEEEGGAAGGAEPLSLAASPW